MEKKRPILKKQIILLTLAFLSMSIGFDFGGILFSFFLYMTLGKAPVDLPKEEIVNKPESAS